MLLDIEAIAQNENFKVTFVLPKCGTVQGFLRSEFTVAGATEYGDPFASQYLEKGNQLVAVGGQILDKGFSAMGKDSKFSSYRLGNLEDTMASWTKSPKPQFSVSMIFVTIKPEDNITASVTTLLKSVYPTRALKGFGLAAPMGYHAPGGKQNPLKIEGTATVQIGKWFRAYGQLIKTVTPIFSKEVTKIGKPLYAAVDVSFEPWRLVTNEEVMEFFRL